MMSSANGIDNNNNSIQNGCQQKQLHFGEKNPFHFNSMCQFFNWHSDRVYMHSSIAYNLTKSAFSLLHNPFPSNHSNKIIFCLLMICKRSFIRNVSLMKPENVHRNR